MLKDSYCEKIPQKLPSRNAQNPNGSKLKKVQLADAYFSEPAPVDLILGADVSKNYCYLAESNLEQVWN